MDLLTIVHFAKPGHGPWDAQVPVFGSRPCTVKKGLQRVLNELQGHYCQVIIAVGISCSRRTLRAWKEQTPRFGIRRTTSLARASRSSTHMLLTVTLEISKRTGCWHPSSQTRALRSPTGQRTKSGLWFKTRAEVWQGPSLWEFALHTFLAKPSYMNISYLGSIHCS